MESPLCPPGTRLIETLLWDGAGFVRLDRHLARITASAAALGFRCRRADLEAALDTARGEGRRRVRLTLGMAGDAEAGTAPLPPPLPEWRLALHPVRLDPDDPMLRHKTTCRALYDEARAGLAEGIDEWIFANRRGELCEGTITTLFVGRGPVLATPAIGCGCLPGVLRAELLDQGRAREAVLRPDDLEGARLWVGNSLRGLMPARLAADPAG